MFVLKNFNFIGGERRKFVGIQGESGEKGKAHFLNIIGLFRNPVEGEILAEWSSSQF